MKIKKAKNEYNEHQNKEKGIKKINVDNQEPIINIFSELNGSNAKAIFTIKSDKGGTKTKEISLN